MYDAIIVGGSYAGLSAAMQLARAGRKICVVDAGRPRNRFTKASHGFFGQDGMPPLEMIGAARSKVESYSSVTMIEGDAVHATKNDDGYFIVTLKSNEELRSAKLLLAFGQVDILPEIPGVAERWGKTVLHCPYCHGFEFKDRPLGVLSSHPLSVQQALLISDWGPTTLFLNGHGLEEQSARAQLAQRGVTLENANVAGLEGEEGELSGVRLADGRRVPIAALYLAPRQRLGSPLAEQLGCALDDGPVGPIIRTDAGKMTTVPGVYASGDIAQVMQNATFASSDGVLAGVSLHRALIFEPLAAFSSQSL
jgi:thioredoxin reductase